ncbi:helix-turn-helix domain-containing protein [Geodermatophilus sp. SYSU D00708]
MSLPQRSPAPALHRQAAYGQRPYTRPAVPGPQSAARPTSPGVRPQFGAGPMGQRPMAVRPGTPHPTAVQPGIERPAPRAGVSFLTVAEVAAIMRVSKMTVYRLVHGGDLAAVRVGRSFRVPEPAVREYLSDARTDVA